MGTAKNRSTRSERLKAQAIIGVQNQDVTFRTGPLYCRMPLSTFHRHFHQQSKPTNPSASIKRGRKPALATDEENTIVETPMKYANRRFPLSREDLFDCVEILCYSMTIDRRAKLPFLNGRPSTKISRRFEARHKSKIRFGKVSAQEIKRLSCKIAANLTF